MSSEVCVGPRYEGKVLELLSDPSRWTRFATARTASGESLLSVLCKELKRRPTNLELTTDPRAVSWCVIGAINKCYPDKSLEIQITLRAYLVRRQDKGRTFLSSINDNSSYDAIMALIKEVNL